MQVHLRELLETRLRLAQAWRGRLEALEASLIQRPVFITGMWRSGSTFLHELLAEDPENRLTHDRPDPRRARRERHDQSAPRPAAMKQPSTTVVSTCQLNVPVRL